MKDGIVLTNIDKRGVAEVTLNRPSRNNAYNGEMISELIKSSCKTRWVTEPVSALIAACNHLGLSRIGLQILES